MTVLILPLAVGAVLSGVLLMIVDAAGLRTALPVALAALFVAWSIGQGRSFRSAIVRWPTPAVAASPRSPSRVAAGFRLTTTALFLVIVLVAQAALAGTSICPRRWGCSTCCLTKRPSPEAWSCCWWLESSSPRKGAEDAPTTDGRRACLLDGRCWP